jgi:hypothetical protein
VRDEAQNTALSEEARNEKRNEAEEKLVELREMEGKIRRFEESRRRQLDEQMKRVRDKLVEEIKTTISTYAKTQGYTAVLDSSGENLNGVPSVLHFDARLDITTAVVDSAEHRQEVGRRIRPPDAAHETDRCRHRRDDWAPPWRATARGWWRRWRACAMRGRAKSRSSRRPAMPPMRPPPRRRP